MKFRILFVTFSLSSVDTFEEALPFIVLVGALMDFVACYVDTYGRGGELEEASVTNGKSAIEL